MADTRNLKALIEQYQAQLNGSNPAQENEDAVNAALERMKSPDVTDNTEEPTLGNLVKYGAETSLTGRGFDYLKSKVTGEPNTPVKEPNYAKWDDSKLKWLLQHGVSTAANLVTDLPAFAGLEALTGGVGGVIAKGANITPKVAEVATEVAPEIAAPMAEAASKYTPEWLAEIAGKSAPKVAEVATEAAPQAAAEVVKNTVKQDALKNILKQAAVMGEYEAVRSPLAQLQDKGEYSGTEHLTDIGTGILGGGLFATAGEGLKSILGEPNLFNEVGRSADKAATKEAKTTVSALRDMINVSAENQGKQVEFANTELGEIEKQLKTDILNAQEVMKNAVNTGEPEAKLLTMPERLFTPSTRVVARLLSKYGIEDPEEKVLNMIKGKYASQILAVKLETQLSKEAAPLLKELDSAQLYELMSKAKVDEKGKIIPIAPEHAAEVKGYVARFKNPTDAASRIKNIRGILDDTYISEGNKVLGKIAANTTDTIDKSMAPDEIKAMLKTNLTNMVSQAEQNPDVLKAILGNKDDFYKTLTQSLDTPTVEGYGLTKTKVTNFTPMPYEESYMPIIPKAEFMERAIKDVGLDINNPSGILQKSTEAPRHQLARGAWGLLPEQTVRDFNESLFKYIRSHAGFMHMSDANRAMLDALKIVEKSPILKDEALVSWKQKLSTALFDTMKGHEAGNIQIKTTDDLAAAIKKHFADVARATGEPLSAVDNSMLDTLFEKGHDFMRKIRKVFVDAKPIMSGKVIESTENLVGKIDAIGEVFRAEKELARGEKVILPPNFGEGSIPEEVRQEVIRNLSGAQKLIESGQVAKGSSVLQSLVSGNTIEVSRGSTRKLINSSIKDIENILEHTKLLKGSYEEVGVSKGETYFNRVEKQLKKIKNSAVDSKKVALLQDEKFQRDLEHLNKTAQVADLRHIAKVSEDGLMSVTNGKAEGYFGDMVEQYTKEYMPTIKSDAGKYFLKWLGDNIGINTEPVTLAGKNRLAGFIQRMIPQDEAAKRGVLGKLRTWFGGQFNPDATIDNVIDSSMSQIYSNLMGWKVTPILRNMSQYAFLSTPGIKVPLLWQPQLRMEALLQFAKPEFRERMQGMLLHAPHLLSETGMVFRGPFKEGSTFDKIYKGKLKLDRVGMHFWEASDRIQRYLTFAYSELAAKKVLESPNSTTLLKGLLNPVYLEQPERQYLLKILAKGTPEAASQFAEEFARKMTNNSQFVYDSLAGSGLQRKDRLTRMAMMFTKWPTEIMTRETRYAKNLFSGNNKAAAAEAVAKDIAYGAFAIAAARALGMDISDWHPLASISGKYESPVLSYATSPSFSKLNEMFTPIPAMTKSVERTFGIGKQGKNRQVITGIPLVTKGQPAKIYQDSAVGSLAKLFGGGKK